MPIDTEYRCLILIGGGEKMTLDIRVPSMAIIETKELWNQTVKDFAVQDVYYTYEYNEWNAKQEKGIAKLVHFQNSLGSVIYPFIVRKIDFEFAGQPVYDITSAYGYGGPLISGDPGVLEEFGQLFEEYCKRTHIVSEIVRMHPLLENARYLDGYCSLQYIRKTTAVNLVGELSAIQQRYSHMTKRNIKRLIPIIFIAVRLKKMRSISACFLNFITKRCRENRLQTIIISVRHALKTNWRIRPFPSHI